jgi:hypothetical protein
MKKLLIIIGVLTLSGCTALPISQRFPEAPEVLLEKCPPLKTIDKSEVLLSEFTTTVVENYGKYHMCAAVVEAWQEWYKENSKIFNQVNK